MNRYEEIEEVTKDNGWYKFSFVKNGEKLEELQQNTCDHVNAFDRYIELYNDDEIEELKIFKEIQ